MEALKFPFLDGRRASSRLKFQFKSEKCKLIILLFMIDSL